VGHSATGCPVNFRLERDVSGLNRAFTPDEAAVFSDITSSLSDDGLEYTLHFEATTDNLALENKQWTIAVVAERGLGTERTPVRTTFDFRIRNVCRDLPWTDVVPADAAISYNAYEDQAIPITRLGLDQAFPVEWATEHCEISYRILYKAGPLLTDPMFERD
jgi:hypothetical protein